MTLYDDGEVCATCSHATMHSCGKCLKECKLDLRPNLEDGMCRQYDGKDEKVIGRMARQKDRAKALDQAVGSCPICADKEWWWNDVPLQGFCWGSDKEGHKEIRVLPPPKLQPYWNGLSPKEREGYIARYQKQERDRHGIQTCGTDAGREDERHEEVGGRPV